MHSRGSKAFTLIELLVVIARELECLIMKYKFNLDIKNCVSMLILQFLIVGVGCDTMHSDRKRVAQAEGPRENSDPSSVPSAQWHSIPTLSLLSDSADLRMLVCDREMLRDRGERRVCIVKPPNLHSLPVELKVQDGLTLRKVLLSTGYDMSWRYHIRVIQRNAIVQTRSRRSSDYEEMLARLVYAGDVVIVSNPGE